MTILCKDCKHVRPDINGYISVDSKCTRLIDLRNPDLVTGSSIHVGFCENARMFDHWCGPDAKWFEPRENPARTDAGIGNDRGESLDASDIRPPLDRESPLYRKLIKQVCVWQEDENGNWDTDCGDKHILNEGTPSENNMAYCCYCGGKLIEEPYVDPDDTDDDAYNDPRHNQSADINKGRF